MSFKLKLLSDMHHEHHKDYLSGGYISTLPNDVDVLVLAGDIGSKHILPSVLRQYCDKFKEVVYVAGNHCHWDNSVQGLASMMTTITNSNFHWLHNSSWTYNNQVFHGTTLWFDELSQATLQLTSVRTKKYKAGTVHWPDFEFVEGGSTVIYEEFKKAKEYLIQNVKEGDIVVTHHMPSYKCVSPKYFGDPYNPFFVGDVEEVIINNKPKLWLYGHTHIPNDFTLQDTRLIVNCRGYPSERNFENGVFKPNLTIEL
jgi:predicted phosphodiesterase